MSTRDIQAHVREIYGMEISPDLVSAVTDGVLGEVSAWQNRPLEPVYAIVFFDAIRVKIRDEGVVKNKAVYLAIGIRCSGHKEVLGVWIEQNEGAKFWLKVMTELKQRGTGVLIAVVDGLKVFRRRSRRCSPTHRYRPVSCTCCATRCSSRRGRSVRRSRRR